MFQNLAKNSVMDFFSETVSVRSVSDRDCAGNCLKSDCFESVTTCKPCCGVVFYPDDITLDLL